MDRKTHRGWDAAARGGGVREESGVSVAAFSAVLRELKETGMIVGAGNTRGRVEKRLSSDRGGDCPPNQSRVRFPEYIGGGRFHAQGGRDTG